VAGVGDDYVIEVLFTGWIGRGSRRWWLRERRIPLQEKSELVLKRGNRKDRMHCL